MGSENINNKAGDFDYTIVLDGHFAAVDNKIQADIPEEAAARDAADRIYYEYERMCFKDPTVLDKDDIYPHSYQWRMGEKYDPERVKVVEEALRLGSRIADTDAYVKYIEEIKHRKFMPDSWE